MDQNAPLSKVFPIFFVPPFGYTKIAAEVLVQVNKKSCCKWS